MDSGAIWLAQCNPGFNAETAPYPYKAMRNRAERDAIRWRHLTHQFIPGGGGHQFIALNTKLELRRVSVPTFFSKTFINHSIIVKS